MAIKNKNNLGITNATNITDPLNKQNTAARVREIIGDVIDSSLNSIDVVTSNNNVGSQGGVNASGTRSTLISSDNSTISNGQSVHIASNSGSISVGGSVNLAGVGLTSSGTYSITTGQYNLNSGSISILGGSSNTNTGSKSFIIGSNNTNISSNAIIGGSSNTNNADGSIILGSSNTNNSIESLLVGNNNLNTGSRSIVSGKSNTNSGINSLVLGLSNNNTGDKSIVSGNLNTNNSLNSFVSGISNTNNGVNSIITGTTNNNSSLNSLLIGSMNINECDNSMVLGTNNHNRSGKNSIINGNNILNNIPYQFAYSSEKGDFSHSGMFMLTSIDHTVGPIDIIQPGNTRILSLEDTISASPPQLIVNGIFLGRRQAINLRADVIVISYTSPSIDVSSFTGMMSFKNETGMISQVGTPSPPLNLLRSSGPASSGGSDPNLAGVVVSFTYSNDRFSIEVSNGPLCPPIKASARVSYTIVNGQP